MAYISAVLRGGVLAGLDELLGALVGEPLRAVAQLGRTVGGLAETVRELARAVAGVGQAVGELLRAGRQLRREPGRSRAGAVGETTRAVGELARHRRRACREPAEPSSAASRSTPSRRRRRAGARRRPPHPAHGELVEPAADLVDATLSLPRTGRELVDAVRWPGRGPASSCRAPGRICPVSAVIAPPRPPETWPRPAEAAFRSCLEACTPAMSASMVPTHCGSPAQQAAFSEARPPLQPVQAAAWRDRGVEAALDLVHAALGGRQAGGELLEAADELAGAVCELAERRRRA